MKKIITLIMASFLVFSANAMEYDQAAIKTDDNLTIEKRNETGNLIYSKGMIKIIDSNLSSDIDNNIIIDGPNSLIFDKVNYDFSGSNAILIKNSDIKNGEAYVTFENSNFTLENSNLFDINASDAYIKLNSNNINTKTLINAHAQEEGLIGSNVTLDLVKQNVKGDIKLDGASSLNLTLNNSIYKGSINNENLSYLVNLTLDRTSKIVLTGDTYVNNIDNEVESNYNIYANGHSLYLNGEKISINETKYEDAKEENNNNYDTVLEVAAIIIMIIMIVGLIMYGKYYDKKINS